MLSQRLVGTLEIELQKRPWGVAGRFSVCPAAADQAPSKQSAAPVVVGALLVLPAFLALAAGFLRAQLGVPGVFDAVSRTPALSLVVLLSLFAGAPLAVLINLLPIVKLGLKRDDDEIAATLALTPNLVELGLLVIALAVAGVFFGHLVADQVACWRGIASAC